MKRVLTLLFIAFLLFFFKERLRAECNTKGVIAYIENSDSYSIYFETLPWTDCAGYGLGWPSPLKIEATWKIRCKDGQTETYTLPVADTLKIQIGTDAYITCDVTYYYHQTSPKTTHPFPIEIEGTNPVDCIQLISPDSPSTTTSIQSGTPAPVNLYAIQGGVISIEGKKGIFVLLDFTTMLPVFATSFEDALIYDLNQCCGSGFYLCNIVFIDPYETIEVVTQI